MKKVVNDMWILIILWFIIYSMLGYGLCINTATNFLYVFCYSIVWNGLGLVLVGRWLHKKYNIFNYWRK
jgi:hypothetical protein